MAASLCIYISRQWARVDNLARFYLFFIDICNKSIIKSVLIEQQDFAIVLPFSMRIIIFSIFKNLVEYHCQYTKLYKSSKILFHLQNINKQKLKAMYRLGLIYMLLALSFSAIMPNNLIYGDNNALQFSNLNSIFGNQNLMSKSDSNIIYGNDNALIDSDYNTVLGFNNLLGNSNGNLIGGIDNAFVNSNLNSVIGQSNQFVNSNQNQVTGNGNILQGGGLNSIFNSNGNFVSGKGNLIIS